ncbi:hypothetical protein HPP92_023569 [Vanilla planifolia]|uniref:Uncharacterized protein n=1 Tax=Vanilla planifolia TaxID=51239 RepID=A0A835PKU8_VANPL|nr:hypothetical protein HPP92_023834 [Vanilla planifolia]KAG0455781.1 hypothetical protein HPP92_023569 [Vanilla planifolia]
MVSDRARKVGNAGIEVRVGGNAAKNRGREERRQAEVGGNKDEAPLVSVVEEPFGGFEGRPPRRLSELGSGRQHLRGGSLRDGLSNGVMAASYWAGLVLSILKLRWAYKLDP